MTTEPTSRSQSSNQPAILKLTDGDPFFHRMREISDTLARRAYELFEGRGRQDGHDLEDWLRAESELLNPMSAEISEADDQMVVRADVPGFKKRILRYELNLIVSSSAESGNRSMIRRRSGRLFTVREGPMKSSA